MTQINVCIANKQTHAELKDQLPLPQTSPTCLHHIDQNAKRTEETHRQRAVQDQT